MTDRNISVSASSPLDGYLRVLRAHGVDSSEARSYLKLHRTDKPFLRRARVVDDMMRYRDTIERALSTKAQSRPSPSSANTRRPRPAI